MSNDSQNDSKKGTGNIKLSNGSNASVQDSTITAQESNKKPVRQQRRALVASIATVGAAGLPSEWKRPVVDAILLPAHAQTSDEMMVSTVTSSITQEITVECFSGLYYAVTVSTGTIDFGGSSYDKYSATIVTAEYTQCQDGYGGFVSTVGAVSTGFEFGTFAGGTRYTTDYSASSAYSDGSFDDTVIITVSN